MGCDVCYTNHAEADQDDMDILLTLLARREWTLLSGSWRGRRDAELSEPSFHDILYVRQTLGRRCAPELEDWLRRMGLADAEGRLLEDAGPEASARRWR